MLDYKLIEALAMVVQEVVAMKEREYTKHKATCGLRFRISNGKRVRYMVMVMFLN